MIKINDEWQISADSMNFILRRYNPKAKLEKHKWTVVGYYPTINALLERMVDQRLIGAVYDGLEGIALEVDRIKHDLSAGKWGTARDLSKPRPKYSQE